jgi:hypothetical protein
MMWNEMVKANCSRDRSRAVRSMFAPACCSRER